MHLFRYGIRILVLFTLPLSVASQQPAGPPQTATTAPAIVPVRDTQAIAVLRQARAAMGGVLPSDTLATGSVTIVTGTRTETGTIHIQTRGSDQSVEDISTNLSHKRIVYSRLVASESDGTTTHKLNLQLTLTSQASEFPLAFLAGSLDKPDFSVLYVALETIEGATVHHIRLLESFASHASLQVVSKSSEKDVWIDAQSGLVRKISFVRKAAYGRGVPTALIEVGYSDYHIVSGVLYPFEIKKSINGTPWTTITIQSVSMNSGLSEADFRIQ